MKKRNKILSLMLLAGMLAVMAACGGSDKGRDKSLQDMAGTAASQGLPPSSSQTGSYIFFQIFFKNT
ncbi:MAG: hypothetical protein Q4C65_07695 [Eubacteriales bacterium]|nr:hypothetical protein [Eubacteriales bacterium]